MRVLKEDSLKMRAKDLHECHKGLNRCGEGGE